MWIAHLAYLDLISEGAQLTVNDLTPRQARGLGIYPRAWKQFQNDHQRRPNCQSVSPRGQVLAMRAEGLAA